MLSFQFESGQIRTKHDMSVGLWNWRSPFESRPRDGGNSVLYNMAASLHIFLPSVSWELVPPDWLSHLDISHTIDVASRSQGQGRSSLPPGTSSVLTEPWTSLDCWVSHSTVEEKELQDHGPQISYNPPPPDQANPPLPLCLQGLQAF
jgi:hypothetical protein